MATERITIVVEERGTRVVQRDIEQIGTSAERASRGLDGLRGALAALGVAAVARQFVTLLDTFTNAQNKIGQLVTNANDLQVVLSDLQRIANETRAPFESTVDVYSRLGQSARDLGVSQAEVIATTRTLNQLVALSGSSTQAANAALVQFGQGLGAGALRGEELNSILEQLPNLADVIARGLGVTRGELKKLGEEGKISAQAVLRALREAREEVNGQFARSVPTVTQAFVVLKNRVIELVGELDRSTGISRILSGAVLSLASNLDLIARAAAAAGITIATVLVGRGINAAILGLRALTVAALANPFTALAAAILVISSLLISFSDQLTIAEGSTTTLADVAVAAWEQIKIGLEALGELFSTVFAPLGALAREAFGDVEISITGVLRGAASVADNLIAVFVGSYRGIVAAWQPLPRAIGDIFLQVINGVIATVEFGINQIIRAINAVSGVAGVQLLDAVNLGRIENQAAGGARQLGERVGEAFTGGFSEALQQRPVGQLVDGVLQRADELAEQRRQRELERQRQEEESRRRLAQTGTDRTRPAAEDGGRGRQQRRQVTFEELLQQLTNENTVLRANREEREGLAAVLQFEERLRRSLTEAERTQVLELTRENQLLERLNRTYEDVAGSRDKLRERTEDLNRLFQQGRITVAQYNEELRRIQTSTSALDNTFSGGLTNGLDRIAERMNDLGKGVSDVVVGAFDEATDAIVEFAKTGEFNVNKLFSNIAQQVLRLATNQLFAQLIGSLGGAAGAGGAGGGIISALGGLLGFANGGSFEVAGQGGTDSQLVAFRATPGERVDVSTPQQQQQQGGAPAAVAAPTNIRIVNVINPEEAVAALDSAAGERVIMNTIERNPTAIRRLIGG